ncbi:DUF2934 domain-containing protein [Gluconobacter wancherniae]|uniref:DUF2934 domain-containing protein n=1 Tax=Gluconobacter wancherniae TaxID=1307955 RepID=UPI001B8B72D3|nr:DUF2934 domain-containing protein [Gluconobacter wancherniae]MBS1087842.1 DUF2934 domain-containing protein [Gluconobacter wancherniae]
MSDNPLAPNAKRDAAIKAEAKLLWESEGRPEGGPEAYMERAEDLISIKGVPRGVNVKDLPDPELADVQIENARLQENLGEFPERSTDQGDQRHFPVADRKEESELMKDESAQHGQPGYAQIDEKQEGP